MPRTARVVVPGFPHHILQRGNRRQRTFFSTEDFHAYRHFLAASCRRQGVQIWAYCLMPNHVHVVAVPSSAEALARAFGAAHRSYTARINQREGWRGFLWQGRFASHVMDVRHALNAMRYGEMNPIRAGLAVSPESYPWSSAANHLLGEFDPLLSPCPLIEVGAAWRRFLEAETGGEEMERLRRHGRSGRPLGSEAFVAELETKLGRSLRHKRE
ncbi:MAG: transposase [Alphaproteobacteria bacterium]|jgi:putative transposase|nr:transposase [Rhodospirillaceae bacterium]MDP6404005.1 transposase [Alphaproteobacteria bacterium]MDP6623322.1 transposase [Alphaproteobacteria bacterium]|tara:strand:- start:185 stop:826 length:642 start_codon:yes stop_codon:yes gene_type:complete